MQRERNLISYSFINQIIRQYLPDRYVQFKQMRINMSHFREAMIHTSVQHKYANRSYERLEFLGDAIFHLIITIYLFTRYDNQMAGFLTRLRIRLERGENMTKLAKMIGIVRFIQHDDCMNDKIAEDTFESFVGAFYLTFGFVWVFEWTVALMERSQNLSDLIQHDDNYKDILLRCFHYLRWDLPEYHHEKKNKFTHHSIVCDNKNNIIGEGYASVKKQAEQIASMHALEHLGVLQDGNIHAKWEKRIQKTRKVSDKIKPETPFIAVFNPQNKLMLKRDVQRILKAHQIDVRSLNIDLHWMRQAMTHQSYTERDDLTKQELREAKGCVPLQKQNCKRLQFLGKSVIQFVLSNYLFDQHEEADEGFLTRVRNRLKNKKTLVTLIEACQIAPYVLINQNIELHEGRKNENIMSDAFSAFMGALYMISNIDCAHTFLVQAMQQHLNMERMIEHEKDYKSMVMQIFKRQAWGRPAFNLIKVQGPDHHKKYMIGVYYESKCIGIGKGSSKRKAEQRASKHMLARYAKLHETN